MRSSFKISREVSLILILTALIMIAVMVSSCGNNTNIDSETSDNKNMQNKETPTSSATSEAEDVGSDKTSESVSSETEELDSAETTESNSTETTGTNSAESTESDPTEEPVIDNNVYMIVESNSANPGDKNVEINILFKNNPGILGMDFDLYYDDSVMMLVDAVSFVNTDGCVFTQPKKYHTPSTFLWDFQDDVWDEDGIILKLLFNISETAHSGSYVIEVKYSLGNIFDMDFNPIIIYTNNGVLNILD